MPKIEFIENEYIKPPYVSLDVRFDDYGETKDVEEDVAISLLRNHPDKFRAVDGFKVDVSDETPEGEFVQVKFRRNDFLDEYHSAEVDFTEAGQIKSVREEIARYLLTEHSDKFTLVDESPKPKNEQKKKIEEEIVKMQPLENEVEDDLEPLSKSVLEILESETSEKSPLTMAEIGEIMGMDWHSLTGAFRILEKRNLIQAKEEELEGYKRKRYFLKNQ
jgi:hypothetical protein